ncbi:MAG: hypothetical protein AAGA80_15205 [Cyanobacteria bacterium P01_F01_bin.143]
MSIEPTVVLSRLKFMANNLQELKRFDLIDLNEYLSSFDQRYKKIVHRWTQMNPEQGAG